MKSLYNYLADNQKLVDFFQNTERVKLMKKRIFIVIVILGSIICQLMVLSTGRFFIDYWIRDMLGEYDTNITVTNMRIGRYGTLSAYCDGKYFFYDKSKKSICEYGTGKLIVLTKGTPTNLTVSDRYIYYTTEDALYQCDHNGTEVASRLFAEEHIDGLHVEGKNVYCESEYAKSTLGYAVYIFNADDVSKAGDFDMLDEEWDKATSYYEEGRVAIEEHKVKKIKGGWIVVTRNSANIKVEHRQDSVKVANADFGIIPDGSNEVLCGYQDNIVGIWDGELYSTENGIVRMTSPKGWENYGEDLNPYL